MDDQKAIEKPYDASSIRIPTAQEAFEHMPWLLPETLAKEFNRDIAFIKRGLLACEKAGVANGYFIERYLRDNKAVPFNEAVDYQFRRILGMSG